MSLTLHLGLLGWALINFAGTPPLKTPEVRPVEVAIISEDDLVRLKRGDRSSKKLKTRKSEAKDEAKKPKPVKKRPPPRRVVTAPPPPAAPKPPAKPQKDTIAEKIAALAPPKPDPAEVALKRRKAEAAKKAVEAKKRAAAAAARKKKAAEAAKKRKAAAERKRRAVAKKNAEERRKRQRAQKRKREAEKRRKAAEKKKRQFDESRIAALLNKLPDQPRPTAGSPDDNVDRKLPRGAQAGAPEGRDDKLTASQISMIGQLMKNQTTRCWNINSGLQGASELVVELVVRLKPDGSLDGQPTVSNRRSGAAYNDAALSAMRAVIQCAPYDLPKKLYKGGWDHMVVTFDPQKMF